MLLYIYIDNDKIQKIIQFVMQINEERCHYEIHIFDIFTKVIDDTKEFVYVHIYLSNKNY